METKPTARDKRIILTSRHDIAWYVGFADDALNLAVCKIWEGEDKLAIVYAPKVQAKQYRCMQRVIDSEEGSEDKAWVRHQYSKCSVLLLLPWPIGCPRQHLQCSLSLVEGTPDSGKQRYNSEAANAHAGARYTNSHLDFLRLHLYAIPLSILLLPPLDLHAVQKSGFQAPIGIDPPPATVGIALTIPPCSEVALSVLEDEAL